MLCVDMCVVCGRVYVCAWRGGVCGACARVCGEVLSSFQFALGCPRLSRRVTRLITGLAINLGMFFPLSHWLKELFPLLHFLSYLCVPPPATLVPLISSPLTAPGTITDGPKAKVPAGLALRCGADSRRRHGAAGGASGACCKTAGWPG